MISLTPLPPGTARQTLTLGPEEAAPVLPSSLTGKTAAGETAVLAITWTGCPDYRLPGSYVLTPQLPYGYTLAAGVRLPQIQLTLLSALAPDGTFSSNGLAYQLLMDGESIQLTGHIQPLADTLVIPDSVEGPDGQAFAVTRIESSAFQGASMENISLPGGLYTIGDHAFKNCSQLTSLSLPGSLSSLGRGAFQNCDTLTSATLPAGLTVIGDNVLADCANLSRVTLVPGSTIIGAGAFRNCGSLTQVTVPDSVTAIGPSAFENCRSLTHAPLSQGLGAIPKTAFAGCARLQAVTIPAGVTAIGAGAFENCSALSQVTLLGPVTAVGANAFSGCAESLRFTILHAETQTVLENAGIPPERIHVKD